MDPTALESARRANEELQVTRQRGRLDRLREGLVGDLMAEFFGTLVLIAFGCGASATVVVGLSQSGRAPAADWLLISLGWGVAVAMAVYVAGGITGAHINPAATLAFAVRGAFPWRKVLPYWVAQVAGAFVGAAIVYLVYYPAIYSYEAANRLTRNIDALATFSIFGTYPAQYFHGSWVGPLIDQIVGSAFLLILIAALIDKANVAPGANMAPLLVGLAVSAISMSYGVNAGFAINPARDFGPRLFAFFAGWGAVALPGTERYFQSYFWIPIVGPLLGAVLGIRVYDFFVQKVLRARTSLVPGRE